MDTVLQRILDLMKEKNISAMKMEKYLQVPRGSFSNWKRGMGKLYYSHIDKIADKLEVPIDYLIRGKETNIYLLSDQEKNLINYFRKMSIEEQNEEISNIKMILGE